VPSPFIDRVDRATPLEPDGLLLLAGVVLLLLPQAAASRAAGRIM
jgi:hypothetical protein